MKKQLERMHKQFGRNHVARCGTCCNLLRGRYHDRRYAKCLRYGCSHADTTDWAASWQACGAYDKPLPDGERPVMEYADRRREPVGEVPGQVGLRDLMSGEV